MNAVPFSFPVDVASLPSKGRDYKIAAKAEDRAAIARALGLESVAALTAELSVTPGAGGAVSVNGSFTADVIQACVVTLQPVPAHLSEPVARRFVANASPKSDPKRKSPAPEPEEGWVDPHAEITDPLIGDAIDLGEILTEQLSLALDPYPRAPGVAFGGATAAGQGGESPFAALAALKLGKSTARRGPGKPARAAKKRSS